MMEPLIVVAGNVMKVAQARYTALAAQLGAHFAEAVNLFSHQLEFAQVAPYTSTILALVQFPEFIDCLRQDSRCLVRNVPVQLCSAILTAVALDNARTNAQPSLSACTQQSHASVAYHAG